MLHDRLALDLYAAICRIPLIDPHSHINPHRPTAKNLDDILGYHYYTELAHSAGMDQAPLAKDADPRERVREIIYHMAFFDNTVQYHWFLEIARAFLDFDGDRLTIADATWLFNQAERLMAAPDWEEQVLRKSHIEKIFLTNDFDDPLEGFDTNRYVPCLRTDDLVFGLHKPEVRERVAKATGIEVGDGDALHQAIRKLFEHFTARGAKACAISLPPNFAPYQVPDVEFRFATLGLDHEPEPQCPKCGSPLKLRQGPRGVFWGCSTYPQCRHAQALSADDLKKRNESSPSPDLAAGIFWLLAEHCREFGLPFDLMIGVNRRVYEKGVYQGQDLFDQRTSLIQYAELFNAFPEVTFPISVLSSSQNQELVSYSWIFPNVVTNGHWWYSNVPPYIEPDLRARLSAVPKIKQIGYYSDAYKLEFCLPKYNMYRRILAQVLADDFVRPHVYTESQALQLARLLLRDNVRRIFEV